MKLIGLLLIFIIIETLGAQDRWYQKARKDQINFRDLFLFETLLIPTENPDTTQLMLYIKIANDMLQFVSADSKFTAQYELSVNIKNEKDEFIGAEIIRKKVSTDDFQKTNSRDIFNKEKLTFTLCCDVIKLTIDLFDLETKKSLKRDKMIKISKVTEKSLVALDPIFYHREPKLETPSTDFPIFPPIRTISDSTFYARLYLYSKNTPQSVRLVSSIITQESHIIYSDTIAIIMNKSIHPVDIDLNHKLSFGQYDLLIELIHDNNKIEKRIPFYIRWEGHSLGIPSLNLAIQSLIFILNPEELKGWKDLSESQREEVLENFWKKRDPDPTTSKNELEEEFYRRVMFAHYNFSLWQGKLHGWQTDRGRIYIIYGPPSEIERPATQGGTSGNIEIWFYDSIQKRFVFEDKYGNGEYRLISQE